ncbi:MAG: hypothetical protein HY062_16335 [Bacteroidetes bacterium]|nr:hypothetical protein [Bacteroidota bacterium]
MKKCVLLAFLMAGLGFASCKKTYSCQCSTTLSKTGYDPYTVSSVEKNDIKTTKKTAEKICAQTEKQLTSNDADYISGNEQVTISCAAKL